MSSTESERLFCEIAISLGLISKTQRDIALEKQRIDRAIGENKPIGSYFLSEEILLRDQINLILKEQEKREKVRSILKNSSISEQKEFELSEGESIERGFCYRCSKDVPVKVTKNSPDYSGCGFGCVGEILNVALFIITGGSWGFVWVGCAFYTYITRSAANDLVVCLKCGGTLKK